MGQAAKKLSKVFEDQPESLPNNDHNPYWKSALFNDTFLRNDVPVQYKRLWEEDEAGPFYLFSNRFRELCDELKDVDFDSWSERNTINRLIKPVLKMLGYTGTATQEPWAEDEPFSIREDGELNTYKPDFIIVNDPKELKYIEREKGDKKLEAARESVILPIEAKYWGRIEDVQFNGKEDSKRADKKDQADSSRSMSFDDQCLKYMEILKKDYGILTDGKTWRLYNFELSSANRERYFQFNLGHLIKLVNLSEFDKSADDYRNFLEQAKYFFHLFSKQSLFSETGERPFVDDLLEYSKKYATRAEEDLRERFVKAMAFACNGFLRSVMAEKEDVDLSRMRNVAESHLFNILFIIHCESRNILPLRQSAEYRKVSLSNTIDKLVDFRPEREEDNLNLGYLKRVFASLFAYKADGTELYDRLLELTKVIQDGTRSEYKGFEIQGFRESIFSRDEWRFAQKHKLTNGEMVNVLFELGYCASDIPGRRFQRIPYNYFSPRQLGSIYESFLEFKIDRAKQDMAFQKGQWSAANLKSDKMKAKDVPKVRKGQLFFTPDNEDRKATGSYYTPDSVVQFILAQTVGVQVKGKTSGEILKMRVCDPAMGSSHFLGGALNYLARVYLTRLGSELNDDLNVSLIEAKQRILHNCIFGVDINDRAVKLAKLSLWMESASPKSSLESLDDQLKIGNSVGDDRVWNEWGFLKKGVDAVVGNPPYLGEKGHKEIFQPIANGWLGKRFYQGKMDLLYFFFHLGLDILKPEGRLGFITTNYFPTAAGGVNLRKDLAQRSSIRLLMNLNEVRVFGEAAGQHNMITVLSKGVDDVPTTAISTTEKSNVTDSLLKQIVSGEKGMVQQVPKSDLYDGEEFYIRLGYTASNKFSKKEMDGILSKIRDGSVRLDAEFNINTGLQSGADKVSDRHIKKFGIKSKKGDGIFVLKTDERKDFSASCKSIFKPLFKNSDIGHFMTKEKADLSVLYIGRDTKVIPTEVRSHLSKFKGVLDSRREVQNKVIEWFQLQWPRTEDIFSGEKIVAPQRSKMNVFGYNEISWYASTDVYFITKKATSKIELKFALGLLNSKVFLVWLYFMGKRKGEMLELLQKPLSEIPIRAFDAGIRNGIIKDVEKLLKDPENSPAYTELNKKIYSAYGLSKAEVNAIEAFYESRVNMTVAEEEEPEDEEAA